MHPAYKCILSYTSPVNIYRYMYMKVNDFHENATIIKFAIVTNCTKMFTVPDQKKVKLQKTKFTRLTSGLCLVAMVTKTEV